MQQNVACNQTTVRRCNWLLSTNGFLSQPMNKVLATKSLFSQCSFLQTEFQNIFLGWGIIHNHPVKVDGNGVSTYEVLSSC